VAARWRVQWQGEQSGGLWHTAARVKPILSAPRVPPAQSTCTQSQGGAAARSRRHAAARSSGATWRSLHRSRSRRPARSPAGPRPWQPRPSLCWIQQQCQWHSEPCKQPAPAEVCSSGRDTRRARHVAGTRIHRMTHDPSRMTQEGFRSARAQTTTAMLAASRPVLSLSIALPLRSAPVPSRTCSLPAQPCTMYTFHTYRPRRPRRRATACRCWSRRCGARARSRREAPRLRCAPLARCLPAHACRMLRTSASACVLCDAEPKRMRASEAGGRAVEPCESGNCADSRAPSATPPGTGAQEPAGGGGGGAAGAAGRGM
jgi:hypothetical protein